MKNEVIHDGRVCPEAMVWLSLAAFAASAGKGTKAVFRAPFFILHRRVHTLGVDIRSVGGGWLAYRHTYLQGYPRPGHLGEDQYSALVTNGCL